MLRYHEGVEIENNLFQECMASEQSIAQRHMFFSEGHVLSCLIWTPLLHLWMSLKLELLVAEQWEGYCKILQMREYPQY